MLSTTGGVLGTVLLWSRKRPEWQRDALRRIVSRGKLDQTDLNELAELCKVGRRKVGSSLKASPLSKKHLPTSSDRRASVSLASITDVRGVNNLAPDQELKLEPQGLSIIYGDNGTGKSGYVRILKSACGARHKGTIEPNAYSHQQSSPKASASISYTTNGHEQPSEEWTSEDPPHPTISAVRVFDSDCASVHIEKKNEVVFLPFGLDIPDELARACRFVRGILESEVQRLREARNAVFSNPPWSRETQVGKALGALRHDTEIRGIERLGTLSADEVRRISELRRDLVLHNM